MMHPTPPLELPIAGQLGAYDTAPRLYLAADILAVEEMPPARNQAWTRVIAARNTGGYSPMPLADILGELEARGWRGKSCKTGPTSLPLRDAVFVDDGRATVRLVDEDAHGQRLQATFPTAVAHLDIVRQPVEVSA